MYCSRCKKRIAVVFITRVENGKTINDGLCIQCARELGIKPVNDLVEKMGVSDEDLENMGNELENLIAGSSAEGENAGGSAASPFPFLENLFQGANTGNGGSGNEKTREPKTRDTKTVKHKYLDSYCINLTGKAEDGKIDRIVGREREIYRVEQILCRRTKNNPCLIGEPGVGKTAIAEGLALKIASGDIPPRLADREIYLLDLTALVAGTQFRGQFEGRIKGLVDEVKKAGNIILFIDEVHNLVGTGDAEGSMNAANILKPALSRGEIQVIGATTFEEYRKYIEKDAALERRFQPVKVQEPSLDETLEVLKGIRDYYERFHGVRIPEELLEHIVIYSERYITDRFLPDKAIDLLDESCSCAALRNKAASELAGVERELTNLKTQEEQLIQTEGQDIYKQLADVKSEECRLLAKAQGLRDAAGDIAVTEDDLAHVIELWTGIPASRVQEQEFKRLATLQETLKKKIIGQDEAVEAVSLAIRRSRVQISPRRRPASFIFVGPTGVGKTELVKVLSAELFDQPDSLIRLDMSEFMEKHSVSRIIGAPPGYVGYDEAGQLTEKVRRKPYSVILMDEIEKAHPDVLNVLLQILDDGHVTDSHGRKVNFENTVIVMTSNAGSDKRTNSLGFNREPVVVAKERAQKALADFLRPEFLSRIDEIVVFRPLTEEDFGKIAGLMLNELKTSLAQKNMELLWDDALIAALVKKSVGGKFGARDLRRNVRREIEDKVAELLVTFCDRQIKTFSFSAENDSITATAI
ncbi:ATP-dependent Clp protease ATP-binding subunit [Ethanoligenens harbinense]|uniref:ATPase AAA-2 domain protein n=1 Tax=Ethanoligenens harbinense (strain DSM 18485 / JCM 12961 / CGMCC 1.5033 / YUAN-3) TaxID=663278 RepID=E6U469_ETHHY|nr:ATP-dependent Clp protease ATP-binding subunit [Ethanoligenens harbinense]ADU26569.1 ATPase AAA-2 domain protein [Ethanoligenens harbinense YUAN-3]AVQ95695.1 ATP-dependent Clp protease ATP-binding subunit [Ethanoligenens harbinense YUAN-3]AYF38358.1 ATP-dependent Clp protease ATP-binding subunit [Ethanoligenens harbinense]AYF41103.1 ATP-dependent Clp protease ATP-binding subunit [Ethanoligenens harbinense]QCN91934.1 ATP-dependent Clp protease ATP-binding subunit [Ethanoligenens harbinense]